MASSGGTSHVHIRLASSDIHRGRAGRVGESMRTVFLRGGSECPAAGTSAGGAGGDGGDDGDAPPEPAPCAGPAADRLVDAAPGFPDDFGRDARFAMS